MDQRPRSDGTGIGRNLLATETKQDRFVSPSIPLPPPARHQSPEAHGVHRRPAVRRRKVSYYRHMLSFWVEPNSRPDAAWGKDNFFLRQGELYPQRSLNPLPCACVNARPEEYAFLFWTVTSSCLDHVWQLQHLGVQSHAACWFLLVQ